MNGLVSHFDSFLPVFLDSAEKSPRALMSKHFDYFQSFSNRPVAMALRMQAEHNYREIRSEIKAS
jgi:hypothetical protein